MRAMAPCLALSVLIGIWSEVAAPAQETSKTASVQIVNATSVPVLSLRVNGALVYDTFPQGKRSGDAAIPLLEVVYEAEDKQSGSKAKSDKITFEPGANQSLVILGDFSTTSPAGILSQPEKPVSNQQGKHSPNVLFQVYRHTPSKAAVRLRIINGIPGKRLTFAKGNQKVVIRPGECAILESQPATGQYTAEVDGESIPLLMRQEGLIRNAIVVFFLKAGKPSFVRAFENNAESKAMRAELEKARE